MLIPCSIGINVYMKVTQLLSIALALLGAVDTAPARPSSPSTTRLVGNSCRDPG
ncbi:hypothetical protein TPAR_00263 [Tolypocladium paradoxum]|uniref:Uncharacterized protein n=1 Tax=Tolypocladium paradoxum TaxID=94208 RepID=A0A2S4LAR9_9HYPO|nr:hypothetical protein TPAR_00263 [Tolypocladium paradoxum]